LTTSVCSQTKKAETSKQNELKENLTLQYIANEGVLISSGKKQILIDGLHREYKTAYAFPPADLLRSLENAKSPYDKIDLILVSHIHLDHFHFESVGLHLKNNPKSILATSGQAIEQISENFADYGKIKSQIIPIKYEWKKTTEIIQDGIKVKFLGLRHANPQHRSIQNLGHIIEIGGKNILHIGDADMITENFSTFNIAKENIDVAIIPYWYLTSESGRKLVKEQFAPKHIIAVHISPSDSENVAEQIKEFYPDATAFTKILEEKSF
jgi:L-ascorbate metabolism protein UlaG (beta-lactamase superfamily)